MLLTGVAVVIGLGLLIETQQWGYVFALIALAGFGIGGQQLALNYLVVAAYPTQVRATATERQPRPTARNTHTAWSSDWRAERPVADLAQSP